MKKYRMFLLLLVMVLGVAGCANDQEQKPVRQKPSEGYKKKYDPPVTITTVRDVGPNTAFKNGETIANNVATRWAHDQLGITIKTLWYVPDRNDAFETKLRLMLQSGQKMPDFVVVRDQLLAQDLIDSGIFRNAGDLFDRYANETWKKAMAFDPNVWNAFIRNGKRMGIPVLNYAYNNDYVLWIRQDWMDKLKLKAPKTIQDLENIMEKFKNSNPQGLKPKDVVPLSIGFKSSMNTWMGDPAWIFGAYGTLPEQWNKTASGKLEYGSVQPGMKEGLLKIKEWREKGLIPNEGALWDEIKTADPAIRGTAGIIPGPYWMSGWPLKETKKNQPEAVWKPYPIPAGPNGKAGRHGTQVYTEVLLINKNMKHPEALFTYQNDLFDHVADPDPNDPWAKGIFKGYDYDIVNGKTVYNEDIPGGYVNVNGYFLMGEGARIPDVQINNLIRLSEGAEPKTAKELEIVNNFGAETASAAKLVLQQEQISKKNLFTGPQTPTMKDKWDYLSDIENRTINEIIYGKKSPDSFDYFVQTWKQSGGSQITDEVNNWYTGIQKSKKR
ncbi:sugar ABC transporter [Fictibacillus enclensis]|uniref:sugar ABC transporter n=1 Tax=Fictibacillus enclensis TaxID=1017270 RepID=UPI003CD0C938